MSASFPFPTALAPVEAWVLARETGEGDDGWRWSTSRYERGTLLPTRRFPL